MGKRKYNVQEALERNQPEVDALLFGSDNTGTATIANLALNESVVFRNHGYTHATLNRHINMDSIYFELLGDNFDEGGRMPVSPKLEIALKTNPGDSQKALKVRVDYQGTLEGSSFGYSKANGIMMPALSDLPVESRLIKPTSYSVYTTNPEGAVARDYITGELGSSQESGEYARLAGRTIEAFAETMRTIGQEALFREHEY